MARWQLTEAHYLNVPGNETEDRTKGDNSKKKLPAPMHLDPNDEKQWNYREMIAPQIMEGRIIVCHEGKGEPKDIIFVGDPTPGMLPLDDEAKAISAKFSWTPSPDLDEANSFSHRLLLGLLTETAEAKQQAQASSTDMSELMKGLADMMKMQTQLLAALAGKTVAVVEPEPTAPKPEELSPEAREFKPAGKGPASIRDARRLAARATEPAE